MSSQVIPQLIITLQNTGTFEVVEKWQLHILVGPYFGNHALRKQVVTLGVAGSDFLKASCNMLTLGVAAESDFCFLSKL